MSRNSPSDPRNEVADFLQSAQQGNLVEMEAIKKAKSDIDIDAKSVTGQTALMFASIGSVAPFVDPDYFSRIERATPAQITEWLLSQGANPALTDNGGYGAIHHAARNREKDVVEILINTDRSLMESDVKGWRPLHFAVSNNHYDLARMLIENGADVNAEFDHEGKKYRAADLAEHILLERDRKAMSELISTASKVTAQISEEGLSSPRARSLSGDKSESKAEELG